MKKKVIAIISSLVLGLSIVAVAAFAYNRPADDKENSVRESLTSAQAKAKDVSKVSLDSAIDIALEDAGVEREDAALIGQPSLDKDDEKPHYDIEFKHGNVEYEYEIAVDSGAVIKAEKEKEKVTGSEKASEKVTEKEKDEKKKEEKTEKKEAPKPSQTSAKNDGKEYISIEKAKEIALNNAGVSKADAVFKKAYYDSDDLVAHFDVKFVAGGYEYEYEIKASDGKILEKDIEKEPVRENATKASEKEIISKNEAKAIAIAHAKVDAGKVKALKIELDRDDVIAHYEVEFIEGRYEYEYEINAESGKIIAYDKDFND